RASPHNWQNLGETCLKAAPICEVVKPCPFDHGEANGCDEGQALHQQHDSKDVDLPDFLDVRRNEYDGTQDQKDGEDRLPESVEIGRAPHPALGGSYEGQMILEDAETDGARDGPLYGHCCKH